MDGWISNARRVRDVLCVANYGQDRRKFPAGWSSLQNSIAYHDMTIFGPSILVSFACVCSCLRAHAAGGATVQCCVCEIVCVLENENETPVCVCVCKCVCVCSRWARRKDLRPLRLAAPGRSVLACLDGLKVGGQQCRSRAAARCDE
jgi:hypothetical protein